MKTETIALVVAGLLVPATASSEVVWTGGFETGDLSEFNYLLNPTIDGVDYTTVVEDVVTEGTYAARIELHDDARWSNGLRRVELQHSPDAARTAEGATTFFAWSFFLPEELTADPSQQIGYWESSQSYRQMMAFTLRGSDLSFVTRQPDNVVQWDGTGVATPGEWHRVVMRVHWSKDPDVGSVSVWFDGEEVVSDAAAKTLNDDNPHFVQIGLLRGDMDFGDVPVIYIDDALEADSLAEARPDIAPPPMEPGPSDMGTNADAGSDADMDLVPADTGGAQPEVDMDTAPSDTGGTQPDVAMNDDGGSGGQTATDEGCCAHVRPRRMPGGLLVVLFGFLLFRRRRER